MSNSCETSIVVKGSMEELESLKAAITNDKGEVVIDKYCADDEEKRVFQKMPYFPAVLKDSVLEIDFLTTWNYPYQWVKKVVTEFPLHYNITHQDFLGGWRVEVEFDEGKEVVLKEYKYIIDDDGNFVLEAVHKEEENNV